MENGQSEDTTDELEVIQMLRIDTRVRVDLKSIIVMRRVLEETIERVELAGIDWEN